SFEFQLGLSHSGLGQILAGGGGQELSFGGLDVGDVTVRFDLDQQITLLHGLALFDRQLDNFAADLGTDLHLQHGLDLAVGNDGFGDVAARDFFRLHGNDGLALAENGRQRQSRQQQSDRREDKDPSA